MRVTVLAGVLSVTAASVGMSVLTSPVVARLAASSAPDVPLANMADSRVSSATLDRLMGPTPAPALVQNLGTLSAVTRQEALRAFLVAQARDAGMDRELAAPIERAGEQVLVEAYLARQSEPPQDFPSAALTRAYYDTHPDLFELPERYRLAHIWLARPDTEAEVPAVRQQAHDLAQQAARKDFALLARTVSDADSSATDGGALGWVTAAQVREDVRPVVMTLAPGAVSDAIELPDGWHILRVDERAAPGVRPFDEVRAAIRAELRTTETARRREAYLSEVVRVHPVTVDEMALRDWQAQRVATAP